MIYVRRIWREPGEDQDSLHLQFVDDPDVHISGQENGSQDVKINRKTNPDLFSFIEQYGKYA